MQIRKAKPKDAKGLVEMGIQLILFEKRIDPTFKALDKTHLKEFEKYIKDGIKRKENSFILIAETQKKIVGYIYGEIDKRPPVYLIKKRGTINSLYIKEEHRNKGIGKKLIKAALKEFKKKKLKHVWLGVLSENKKALNTYKKLGFKEFKKEMKKTI